MLFDQSLRADVHVLSMALRCDRAYHVLVLRLDERGSERVEEFRAAAEQLLLGEPI